MCESRGGRQGLPVPNSPYGLCISVRAQELCESRGGCPVLPVPNSPHGLCGRKPKLKPAPHHLISIVPEVAIFLVFAGLVPMLLYVHRDRTDYQGPGTQDVLLDFHTAPELRTLMRPMLLYVHRDCTDY